MPMPQVEAAIIAILQELNKRWPPPSGTSHNLCLSPDGKTLWVEIWYKNREVVAVEEGDLTLPPEMFCDALERALKEAPNESRHKEAGPDTQVRGGDSKRETTGQLFL
jgi:hypothetical protein